MDLSAIIQTYGYPAVFVGTFLEGETVLLLAGFASHRGYLALEYVIATAIAGSVLGDQLFFLIGRRYGRELIARYPSLAPRAERVAALLQRHHQPLILSLRFLYGLRIAGPIAIGMANVPWHRFFLLNCIGAVGWTSAVAGAGYLFGNALELLIADLRRYDGWAFAGLAIVSAGWWLRKYLRRRRTATR